jgi:hypothetical protein
MQKDTAHPITSPMKRYNGNIKNILAPTRHTVIKKNGVLFPSSS